MRSLVLDQFLQRLRGGCLANHLPLTSSREGYQVMIYVNIEDSILRLKDWMETKNRSETIVYVDGARLSRTGGCLGRLSNERDDARP